MMIIKNKDIYNYVEEETRKGEVQPLYTKFYSRVVIFEQLLYLITYFAGHLLVLIKALPNKA